MWILLSVSTCRRREEIINIWDVHFVGEINLCCHRNLVVQGKKNVKRVRNTMGKIGCWREETRSKVKQMSEQLVQEMGWWREKWRVKERMNAPWHFGEYEGIEWYKLGEYDSRSLSFPNNSFFSPVLFLTSSSSSHFCHSQPPSFVSPPARLSSAFTQALNQSYV